ncbi:septum formation family protein [Microbacterium sp. M1A1_1b]
MIGRGRLLGAVLAVLTSGALVWGAVTVASAAAPPRAAATALGVGSCLDLPTARDRAARTAPDTVPCADEHTHQVFAVAAVPGQAGEWTTRPTASVFAAATAGVCGPEALRGFLGAQAVDALTDLTISRFAPSARGWADGSHRVACTVSVPVDASATPLPLRTSLQGIAGRAGSGRDGSAVVRACRQQAPAGAAWATHGARVRCDLPHSTQEVGAWIALRDGAAELSPATVATRCRDAAETFVGGPLPDGLAPSGVVVRADGASTLRCTIGGGPGDDRTDVVVLPR